MQLNKGDQIKISNRITTRAKENFMGEMKQHLYNDLFMDYLFDANINY